MISVVKGSKRVVLDPENDVRDKVRLAKYISEGFENDGEFNTENHPTVLLRKGRMQRRVWASNTARIESSLEQGYEIVEED